MGAVENDNEARWIKKKNNIGQTEYYCSKCNERALGYPFWECDLKPSNFCPECGRKMVNCSDILRDR